MGGFCKCCEDDSPCEAVDCCGPEEEFPVITADQVNWDKTGQTTSLDCCCTTANFVWTDPEPLQTCCESLGHYQYRHEAKRNDYGWKLPAGLLARQTGCGGTDCASSDCCLGLPELIATWIFYWQDRFNYYLYARNFWETLEVSYGRQLVQCTGDTEPQCRYYIRTILRGRVEASITSERVNSRGQVLDYLHPCFEYVGPDCPGGCNANPTTLMNIADGDCPPTPPGGDSASVNCQWESVCTTCPYPQPCSDFETPSPCSAVAPVTNADPTPGNCFTSVLPYCIKRIKYFDTKPTLGSYNFSRLDTPLAGCDDLVCGTPCSDDYQDESPIIVNSGGIPTPPWWYTNPPTVVTETTPYVLSGSLCSSPIFSTNGYSATGKTTCCEPDLLISPCTYQPCTSPVTVTQTCKGVNDDPRAAWTGDDPFSCRLPTFYLDGDTSSGPNDITGGCGSRVGCGGGGAGAGGQFNVLCCSPITLAITNCYSSPCVRTKCSTTEPCGSADCCYTYTCDCFCECIDLWQFLGHYADIVDYTITNSGAWTPNSCEFDTFDLPITIS